jgi:hypothetical protein
MDLELYILLNLSNFVFILTAIQRSLYCDHNLGLPLYVDEADKLEIKTY